MADTEGGKGPNLSNFHKNLNKMEIDFSGFCEDGRDIFINGAIHEKIPVGKFLQHTEDCLRCKAKLIPMLLKLVKMIPAGVEGIAKRLGGGE